MNSMLQLTFTGQLPVPISGGGGRVKDKEDLLKKQSSCFLASEWVIVGDHILADLQGEVLEKEAPVVEGSPVRYQKGNIWKSYSDIDDGVKNKQQNKCNFIHNTV